MIPAGVEHFAFDAAFFGFLLFEEIECQAAQRGEVFGGKAST